MRKIPSRKLALSMRGGAARPISYLAFIKAPEENEIEISMLIGSSAGALIAVAYSEGYKDDEILEIAKSLNLKNSLD